ncbi:DoxX family protein [Dyadobacter psychrotolerans]|uniref:DoxX family protein n=1 Tax=Dyadobacter psychrotolerans TaxID=2541721 RepID=A0A4R5DN16_9BACT|nr:DoxX family protein [Dyadobacter psychrotolerans]TDE15569.1 DoxX family protein [Dyadobacter psychrotolerans]
MTTVSSSKSINTLLWAAQWLLAITLTWSALTKLLTPVNELAQMWPWVGQTPVVLVQFTGFSDMLGALGLLLPSLLRIKPILTPIAAVSIIVLMLCAALFHIVRGETSQIGVNIVFALIAAFTAWGRFGKSVITAK